MSARSCKRVICPYISTSHNYLEFLLLPFLLHAFVHRVRRVERWLKWWLPDWIWRSRLTTWLQFSECLRPSYRGQRKSAPEIIRAHNRTVVVDKLGLLGFRTRPDHGTLFKRLVRECVILCTGCRVRQSLWKRESDCWHRLPGRPEIQGWFYERHWHFIALSLYNT